MTSSDIRGQRVPPEYDRSAIGAAWQELLAIIPPTWTVAHPSYHIETDDWRLYAWDATEPAKVGKRSRDWTAVGATEVDVVREMARIDWTENSYDPDALGAALGPGRFARNLVRFRAEMRAGFAVTRPSGFVTITIA